MSEIKIKPRSSMGGIAVIFWVAGVVLAQGFWSTFFAFLIPFWGWYVAIRYLLIHFGILV